MIEAIHAGNDATRDCTYSQSARFRLSTECLALIEELSGFPNRRLRTILPMNEVLGKMWIATEFVAFFDP